MPKLVFDISISLDGFMTAANQTPDEPMGPGGQAVREPTCGPRQRNLQHGATLDR